MSHDLGYSFVAIKSLNRRHLHPVVALNKNYKVEHEVMIIREYEIGGQFRLLEVIPIELLFAQNLLLLPAAAQDPLLDLLRVLRNAAM